MITDADILAVFNAANTDVEALAAIHTYASTLLSDADTLAKLTELPDGGGREKAIGLGVIAIKDLFGPFDSVADIKLAVEKQIGVEHAKFEFITALDGATTADAMADAIADKVELVNQHRQDLIKDLLASNDPEAIALAGVLQATDFTKILAEIVSHLDDAAYMADLGAKMLAARGTLPDGQFYGDANIIAALKNADAVIDAAALVAAFNGATTDAAILAAIKANPSTLLDADTLAKLTELPDGGGREKAIGLGVIAIKDLFGPFDSVADIKLAVEKQIGVEHAKFEFITALDGATTADAMADAIADKVELVNQHRQDLIKDLLASNDPEAIALAGVLQATDFTKILAEIVSHLDDAAYMADLGAKMLAARGTLPDGQFYGDANIIAALKNADAVIDEAALVAAFNAADTDVEALAAIHTYASALLDADHLAKLDALPDSGGREKAIGLGVNELKALFGDFTSEAAIKAAVEKQIDVEHAKHVFIGALDGATTADAMADAIKATVGLVNQHRQALIAEWSTSSDPDVVARAHLLKTDPYTTALAEIVTHLNDAAYMADLGAKMLAARGTLPGGQFFGVVKIADALTAADAVIDAPPSVPTANIYETSEDTPLVEVAIGAADPNNDDLAFSIKSGAEPKYGSVSFNQKNGTFTYTPNSNVNGSDRFTIVVSDGKGGTAQQVVDVTIKPVNDAPKVSADRQTLSTFEDVALVGVAIGAADLNDGDDLFYSVKSGAGPKYGSVSFNEDSGTFSYTPHANVNGSDRFTIVVSDGKGGTAEQVVDVAIKPANDHPSNISLSNAVVAENSGAGTVVGSLGAFDLDGDAAFNFSLLNDAGGRFTLWGNQLVVANGSLLDYEQAASHQVAVRVTDSDGASHDEFVTVSLSDVRTEFVVGLSTSDQIAGGSGNDRLSGGGGNDVLSGGSGKDGLNGGAGNDWMIGGAGRDTLTGGKGRDVFVFGDKDTSASKKKADYITDFSSKDKDRIDLSVIDADVRKKGNQKFSFISTEEFTKAGQVRYEKTKKETYVYLNTDNDKSAEAVIKLKGSIDLQKGWFVL